MSNLGVGELFGGGHTPAPLPNRRGEIGGALDDQAAGEGDATLAASSIITVAGRTAVRVERLSPISDPGSESDILPWSEIGCGPGLTRTTSGVTVASARSSFSGSRPLNRLSWPVSLEREKKKSGLRHTNGDAVEFGGGLTT